ncbi:MAG TPA: siderophore-interacting protein [Microbacterium sp.]|uniref:siderophore-interacting protein n=1 Tax=Microbacterium sp. TaxID=51671 RepID=UPI002B4697CB|nr:siderophore-interacting protein [Microbacterium sp.]HKT56728.1 siderophore-interacting protein [Microbacterium sp.]
MFERERIRHRFTARPATVAAVAEVGDYVRVTLTGDAFADFASSGPTDHMRVYFPNPVTGELVAPAADGEDGITRPAAQTFGRDFTPLNVRDAGATRTVDIDILRHADAGPAALWAARATVGDELVVVGPKGSVSAPQGAQRALLVVDGTALPAASRFVDLLPDSTEIDVLVCGGVTEDAARDYLGDSRRYTVTEAQLELTDEARDLAPDAGTFVFAAGEASALLPLRRYLRRELGLASAQAVTSGYWRTGVVAWDHHAPIDPFDPED